jgi:hypothetical protein
MATEKQRQVIGEALARTMYDTPLHVLQVLRDKGCDHNCLDEIAERMVRELGRDRWQMKGPPRADNVKLEGLIASALRRSNCPDLASLNPDVAKSGRMYAVDNICKALRVYRIVLVQWRRR